MTREWFLRPLTRLVSFALIVATILGRSSIFLVHFHATYGLIVPIWPLHASFEVLRDGSRIVSESIGIHVIPDN